MTVSMTIDLLATAIQVETPAGQVWIIEMVLERDDRWSLEGHLLPALLKLLDEFDEGIAGVDALQVLREACEVPLRARIAEELTPPPDHVPPESFRTDCADCRMLKAFLLDPWKLRWPLKAVKARRVHIEDRVRSSKLNVRLQTVRESNPHTLIVEKPADNHERKVAQRQVDLSALEALTLLDE